MEYPWNLLILLKPTPTSTEQIMVNGNTIPAKIK